ncbi:RNA chaperone Hfq [Noviherbaspirillum sp. 17J57-3]|uniref:RNA chaperone Hfq n=1 Tax=Noviherbaspirillum galbum TaxID=2709383 RepID=A0A6B3SPY4_9BURK|nr:RNA chaperone Hfq [Noviherbaspirillum galbum]
MARDNGNTLQSTYLNDLRKQHTTVVIYLVSGIKQTGVIESFDQHAVLLRHGTGNQLIYKHTIASVMPAAKAMPALASPTASRPALRAEPQARPAAPVVIRKVTRRIIERE